jgi:hypothetical protein
LCKSIFSYIGRFLTFDLRSVYIYENDLNTITGKRLETDNVSLRIVKNPEEFDRLISEGCRISYWSLAELKDKSTRGAIAFCVFVGQDLGHVTWVATGEASESVVDPFPVKVDWEKEAFSGASRTPVGYRRMGLFTFAYSMIFSFLRDSGFVRVKFTIRKNNTISNHTLSGFGSVVIGEGWYFRFLFIKLWKENLYRR